jgi:transposase-like protein
MKNLHAALAVTGFDVDDQIEKLARELPHIQWLETQGELQALVSTETTNPVDAVLQAALAIKRAVPGAAVTNVVEDFVSIADIARRVGVHRETVRTWVKGTRGPGGFPKPRGAVGDNISIWDWTTVNSWLRENYSLGEEDRLLTADEIAAINKALTDGGREGARWCNVTTYVTEWHQASASSWQVSRPVTARPVAKLAAVSSF